MDLRTDLLIALDASVLMQHAGLPPDPWQEAFLRSAAQRMLLLCSRQSGKSTTTATLALHTALYQPGSLVLLLSPTLRQSQELFRKVLDVYHAVDTTQTEQESALRLELQNGSRIISLPGKEDTIRGYSGVRLLVVDEASRVADSLYYSVRPMLAVSGGRLVCLSTPFGKRGFFHHEWENGQGWEKIKITADQCPRISPEFLAEERRSLGEWWYKQEYGCEFVETVDSVFSYADVMRAVSEEVTPLFPVTGARVGNGIIDPAVLPLILTSSKFS